MPEIMFQYGLVFLGELHLRAFEAATPGKLREDLEWVPAVYMLTMNEHLRAKAACHLEPESREIRWHDILAADYGSGARAAIYWAFTLWSGRNWGGWEDDDGTLVPVVDATAAAYSMDKISRLVALVAIGYRWGLPGFLPPLAKRRPAINERVV